MHSLKSLRENTIPGPVVSVLISVQRFLSLDKKLWIGATLLMRSRCALRSKKGNKVVAKCWWGWIITSSSLADISSALMSPECSRFSVLIPRRISCLSNSWQQTKLCNFKADTPSISASSCRLAALLFEVPLLCDSSSLSYFSFGLCFCLSSRSCFVFCIIMSFAFISFQNTISLYYFSSSWNLVGSSGIVARSLIHYITNHFNCRA